MIYPFPAALRAKVFADILNNENITEISFSLQEDNPAPDEFERFKIKVNEFCETISNAYKNDFRRTGKTDACVIVNICK